MPEKRKISIWYVLNTSDIQDKRGPYNLQQIQELLKDGEILGSDRVVDQEGELTTMTVMDLVKSSSDDPSYRLFEAFQFAKDRNAPKPTSTLPTIETLETSENSSPSWPFILGGLIFLILVAWYWSTPSEPVRSESSRPRPQQTQTSAPAPTVPTAPPTSTPKATPRNTPTPTPTPTPRSTPTSRTTPTRQRDRDTDHDKDRGGDKALGLPLGDDIQESDLSDRDREELNNLNRIQTEDVTPTSLPNLNETGEGQENEPQQRGR